MDPRAIAFLLLAAAGVYWAWDQGYIGGGDTSSGDTGGGGGEIDPTVYATNPVYLQYAGLISSLEQQYGMPSGMLANLLYAESSYNPNAVSGAGAQGIAQLMPATAAGLGVSDPFDPSQAIPGAALYLSQLDQQFGSWTDAVAAYNAGPGTVSNWINGGGSLPSETVAYVQKITGTNLGA